MDPVAELVRVSTRPTKRVHKTFFLHDIWWMIDVDHRVSLEPEIGNMVKSQKGSCVLT